MMKLMSTFNLMSNRSVKGQQQYKVSKRLNYYYFFRIDLIPLKIQNTDIACQKPIYIRLFSGCIFIESNVQGLFILVTPAIPEFAHNTNICE